MPGWVDEGAPFWVLFAFFFTIVLVRTQATYWVARGAARWSGRGGDDAPDGGPRRGLLARWRAAAVRWAASSSVRRGTEELNRWGLVAVPASFLATGTKTVVNAAAGLLAMPYGRYSAAMLLGCAVHATIYATVGWAAWAAALHALAGSGWGALVLAALVAAVVTHVVLRRRRRRARDRAVVSGGGSSS